MGDSIREWLCVSLGLRRPYKQASLVVWEYGLARWFGPFVNYIIPDTNVSTKSRLCTIVLHMTYLRLAYPTIKPKLKAAIKRLEGDRTERGLIARSNLVDLRDLLEFMIPVVRARTTGCILHSSHYFQPQ